MCAEGDIIYGELAWDGIALHSNYLVRFIHDFLFMRGDQ